MEKIMGTFKFIDASTPPSRYPTGFDGCGFYLGGDTPHIWTAGEIAAIPYAGHLPIFTRYPVGGANPVTDAEAMLNALDAHGYPKWSQTALDFESGQDPAWVARYNSVFISAGYCEPVLYGQLSTVGGNGIPASLLWVGDWDGTAADRGYAGKQYQNYGAYDASVFEGWLTFYGLYSPNPAAAAPSWDGRTFVYDGPHTEQMYGSDIYAWQKRMAARGWRISADGWYGQQSHDVCWAFQTEFHTSPAPGLAIDGEVGRFTWAGAWEIPVVP
jgi:hypothetical protein